MDKALIKRAISARIDNLQRLKKSDATRAGISELQTILLFINEKIKFTSNGFVIQN